MIKLYHYNGTKLKDFYMGPSVKFVLPIIDAFPDKKNGGNFWCGKKGRNGGGWGGSEGVAFFGRKFSRLSFLNTSLMWCGHQNITIGSQMRATRALAPDICTC